jgi:periplasmic protein TonB
MIALGAEDLADLRRWLICGAIVVLAHGAVAAAIAWRQDSDPAEPAGAIVIEFAPVPVAPPSQQTDIPPGPEQIMSDASPDKPSEIVKEKLEEKPEQKIEEETPPEVQPAPNPEVAIQSAIQEVQPETPHQEPHPPAPTTAAPQAAPVQTAAIPAAPAQGRSVQRSTAIPSWTSEIVALLERNKRYPPAAQARREHGVAQVVFTLDRSGHVVDSRVLHSSGAPALDAEALALLQRAQPFPRPPAELTGSQVSLTVPVRFNLK